jgi:hypothetical protein
MDTLGPETPAWEGISPSWVPIVPSVAQWETKAGKQLICTQLPLMMAWGITIHIRFKKGMKGYEKVLAISPWCYYIEIQ